MNYDITVTCAFGTESVLKKELRKMSFFDAKAIDGSINLSGDELAIAKLNMFLHTAERVYVKAAAFPAKSFDELFDSVYSLPWENYLTKSSRVIVNGKSVKSQLFSLSDCQKIIKKAIFKRLTFATKTSYFPENGAETEIVFSIRNDLCTLLINTSGKGLHKRGYRDFVGAAPMKETLACALLLLSGLSAEKPFIDPFCGSGTLVTEGARMALGIAPGRDRDFAYRHWDTFDKSVYDLTLEEARDKENLRKLDFAGYDIDPDAIKLSLRHAEKAGVRNFVHFQVRDVKNLSSSLKNGVIVTNPPYGERLLTPREANLLYRTFGDAVKNLPDWEINVITSAPQFEKAFGKKSDANRKFFNADKECHYYMYNRFGDFPKK